MNLILLTPADFPDGPASGLATVSDRRLQHVLAVHRAQPGDRLRVGLAGGLLGEGEVLRLDDQRLDLRVHLDSPPPAKQPIILLLALPRPKMLKRIVQMVTTLGVEELVLLNSYRVEKSFWQSPWLRPEALAEQVVLGLEQARDTVAPRLTLAPRFKPFVEDELPARLRGRTGLLAHPGQGGPFPTGPVGPAVLAIGPEGGFIPYEVQQLQAAGFRACDLGSRILRVDTAVAVTLGRLLAV